MRELVTIPITTSSLFPMLPTQLTGLARLAAEAPHSADGHLVEFRDLQVRSILNRSVSKRIVWLAYSINPYRGCEFGCKYCYARYTHQFLAPNPDRTIELPRTGTEQLRDPEAFERIIFLKQNAAWLLEQDLKRVDPTQEIALGTATDPYQPLERRQRVTRSILEVFARTRGFALGIVTKSALITRDLELLQEIGRRHKLTVHITVTTMNEQLARTLEPRAPRPDLRISTLARLRAAGIRTGVLCSPLMPGITDSRSSISAVAKAASGSGASFFAAGALFLKPCSLPTFFQFVQEHFPEQLSAYERRYGASAFVSPEYRTRIAAVVDSVCREYRLGRRYEEMPSAGEAPSPTVELQPWLPFAESAPNHASSPN